MAYERPITTKNAIVGDSLDAFVSNLSNTYSAQVGARNAADELAYQQNVVNNNLSLSDQLTARQNQLADVSDDPAESTRIKTEISNLQEQIKQQSFTDAYNSKVLSYSSGATSIDSVISFLQDSLSSTTDPTIVNSINSALQSYTQQKFTLTQTMLKDQTDYALADKTTPVLTAQISSIQSAKSAADIAGNTDLSAALNLQLQSLNQALTSSNIQNTITNFGIATVSGASSALDLLTSYNSQISSADTTTPVTIGGTTYASAQQYWTYTRDSYLADTGSSGFFQRIDQEQSTALKVASSDNTLNTNDLSSAASLFNSLSAIPALSSYGNQIAAVKQDTLQSGADLIAQQISDTYDNNLDLNGAITSLTTLKSLGVNVDSTTQKILTAASSTQSTLVQGLVNQAQTLMSQTPGLSITDAVSKAISQGYGTNLSPTQITNSTPAATATNILGTNQNGTGTQDTRTTIAPAPAPTPATSTPGPSSTGTYTIQAGDTLGAIAAAHGTTVAALASANNISNPNVIQSGATLKIPTSSSSSSTPAAPSAPIAPAPTPVTTTTPVKTVASTPSPVTAPANPTPTPVSPTVTNNTYQIKSGDTLGAIAAAHGTTVANLAKINNIANPDVIQSGATLKLS